MLGWEPKVQLGDGLKLMVDDFKRRLHVDEANGTSPENKKKA